jgi:hypothetical protein
VAAGDDDAPREARPPLLSDLVGFCRRLNAANAAYVVIGGMAVIRDALMGLPDQAIRDMADDDLDRYAVVRVADEFVVGLMKAACGIEYADARGQTDMVEIDGVVIPFANLELLLRTKDTSREKDKLDRAFLAKLVDARRKVAAWGMLDDATHRRRPRR